MPRKNARQVDEDRAELDGPGRYELPWPTSQRWNPQYVVPRNSVDSSPPQDPFSPQLETGLKLSVPGVDEQPKRENSSTYLPSRRDADTLGGADVPRRPWDGLDHEQEEFSDLAHWLETLAELYMNQLDNRARWTPRWLNITRRERFEGLASASITIVDYLRDNTSRRSDPISTKKKLADALQNRPEDCEVRVVLVNDLSRFVMGVLGQLYSVDPDFWFEHLVNSGYAASDSGLKIKNAGWLNWAERETHFHHRPLPGAGQRTAWNIPRRTRDRCWTHLHWGRLGLLHYLGRKGFYEDEMEHRLADGRWIAERDAVLDKQGHLLTKAKQAVLNQALKRQERKASSKHKGVQAGTEIATTPSTFARSKTSNIYRAYSTFEALPRNPRLWNNRDLRVMAPEGISYWSGKDGEGRRTVLVVFDPKRNMRNTKTAETIPSLTFMPREMEVESYSDEELWRTADVDEAYLDPPPPPFGSVDDLKKERRRAKSQRAAERRRARMERLKENLRRMKPSLANTEQSFHEGFANAKLEMEGDNYSDGETIDTASDYDEEYQAGLRANYENPRPYVRDRDFARKYELSTHDLICRYMARMTTTELLEDETTLPTLLTRVILDDMWQLLAEMRIDLDYLDNEFGGDLLRQLTEYYGNSLRQNLCWMRSTLETLNDWTKHLLSASARLVRQQELKDELESFQEDLNAVRARTEKTLDLLVASMGIAQSTRVIEQTSGINKLTELAFFFIPISFITSCFSMQILEFTEAPPMLWTWGATIASALAVTYTVRITLRSPSVRLFGNKVRATIQNRYTPASAKNASRQLNATSTWAIIKFVGVISLVMPILMLFVLAELLIFFLALFGAGAAVTGTALYFIVTRWPEPAVLAPCFVAIALALAGTAVAWLWMQSLKDWLEMLGYRFSDLLDRILPPHWHGDVVDDDDLAKEGVMVYTRQAIELVT
ncbi:hypothetical protein S40285_07770 [Stachybotrys chlorohalonatus IBT 40285]|uniref:Mg2+ transporter protein, CorA-like/Zinc transport protein ZntB n=1 Tax=Stachybotrys chlorohalonatus (strain IBT 40285) TaxID=1283841 RepID=A0A084QIM9_STAC4|nr:hypothetical protein S40285_07770 [Stachybotrys chlorohalonata IBT 40285]